MQAKGAKGQLQIDYEATFGTTPAVPAGISLPFNKASISGKQNLTESQTITGRRDPVAPSKGNVDATGNLTVPLDVRAIGHWLKLAFGAPTKTGAGPYTYVYKVTDTMPSAVIEIGFTDIAVFALYNGCKVSKMAFSFGGDGELTVSIDVMGSKETLGTTSFDTTPTTIVLTRFNNFQAAIQEGGTTLSNCRKVDINIDFGLDGDNYCIGGQGSRTNINEGMTQVTGSVETLFENKTLLDKAINNTETSLKVTLTNGTNSLEISLPEVVYERGTPGIDGPKGILATLPFRAYYQDGADNSVVKITLVNDVAAY